MGLLKVWGSACDWGVSGGFSVGLATQVVEGFMAACLGDGLVGLDEHETQRKPWVMANQT